jgi:hypothetical protein
MCASGAGLAPPPPAPDGAPADSRLKVDADGERAPPGYHWEAQRRKGMLISGIALLGVGYFLSVMYGVMGYSFVTTTSSTAFIVRNRSTYLVYAVPLAGPGLSQLLFATASGYSSTNRGLEFLWATLVSALQLTGVTLGVLGFFTRNVAVRDSGASTYAAPAVRWSVAPFAPGAPMGLSLLIEN